ncbi:MAG: hypothetical protein HZC54_19420 [Verrucomicrobia bacterium]|nr:hypothetical protein [Verrucomicrobiota bacterium]
MSDSLRHEKHDERPLPDPAICRAQRVLPGLIECLVTKPKPHQCPCATFFGNGIFCENPDREAIIARTNAERKTQG